MLTVDLSDAQKEKIFYNYCEKGDLALVHSLFREHQFFKADVLATAYEKAIFSGNIDLLRYFQTYLEFDYMHNIFDLITGAHVSAFQTALEYKQEKVIQYFAQDTDYIKSIDQHLLNYQHPLQYCLKNNLPIELFSLVIEKVKMNPKIKDPHRENHDLLHLSIIADNAIYTEYLLKNFHFFLTEMTYDMKLKKSMCYLDYAEKKKNVPKILQFYAQNPVIEDKIKFCSTIHEEGKKYKL